MQDFLNGIPTWAFKVGYFLSIGLFALTEGLALMRKGSGDTFSELVYSFLEGGPARYVLVAGCFLSVGGWLFVHFFWRGKYG